MKMRFTRIKSINPRYSGGRLKVVGIPEGMLKLSEFQRGSCQSRLKILGVNSKTIDILNRKYLLRGASD